ncbi:MAG: HrpB1 family type III secretion system apparatus protein [Pirellulales bacterium]|nr:HrpB1 family type III secretion system apparatus protein [Pirellulales bacterium]
MKINTETVQRLLEVGLMAAGWGQASESETILRGVQAARPESELPLVAQAVRCMTVCQEREAIALLESALEKNPKSEFAMSMLAFTLHRCGLNQASRNAAQQVVDAGGNSEPTALAKAILETNA